MCLDCGNNCFDGVTNDECLKHTGPDYPKLGIKTGVYYSELTLKLLDTLTEITEEKVELKCLYDDSCGKCSKELEVPQAVQVIIDKICMLTSKDVKYTGVKYCIGESSISKDAVRLLGKKFSYKVEPAINGTNISYNLDEIKKKLPSDYRVGRINTTITGKTKMGKNIIIDTNKSFAGISVENDRFPLVMNVDMHINTPSGDVKLQKAISIPTPQSANKVVSMDVRDYSNNAEIWSVENFMESVAAQVCANTTELESFKNIELLGCEGVNYSSTDIKDIVAYQGTLICELKKQVEELNKVSFSINDDKCGNTEYNTDLKEGFKVLSNNCSKVNKKLGSCGK